MTIMKYSKLTLTIIGLLLSCFSLAEAAKAEGLRSYISPSGSDNRPCTRSQPCRTFDGALAKTDEGGEIIALETGTYDPTTITKSITLTAVPGADVVIRSTTGTAVTANGLNGAHVVLRGLKLSGSGKNGNTVGVSLTQGASGTTLTIENCVITDFGTGINAVNNNNARLGITDSVIRNNNTGLIGRFFGTASTGAFASRSRFENNGVGVYALGGSWVIVKDCVVSTNDIGLLAEQDGGYAVSNSLITKNNRGIEVRTGTLVLASSTISGNVTGIEVEGFVRSKGDNVFVNNEVDKSTTQPVQILTTV